MDNTDGQLQKSIVRTPLHRNLFLLKFEPGSFVMVGSSDAFISHTHLLFLSNRVIDTFSSAMHAHIVYHYLVTSYGNPSDLVKSIWLVFMNYEVPWFLTCILFRSLNSLSLVSVSSFSIVRTILVLILSQGITIFIIRSMFARRIYQCESSPTNAARLLIVLQLAEGISF